MRHDGRGNRKLLGGALCTMFFALSVFAEAQEPKKVPQVGYLSGTSLDAPTTSAFRQGLRDLGYIEGKNILVEYRFERNPDRIPSLVAELLGLKVDVLVAFSPRAILAAKQATKMIPIVMVTTDDPVATGMVDSLARPGGNVTGLTRLIRELGGKRLELLKETVPGTTRVGVLWNDPGIGIGEYETAARALRIQLQSLEVRGPNPDLDGAFQAAAKGRANAFITSRSTLLLLYSKRIADLAIKNRLPSMYAGSEHVEAGGLMSYSSRDIESFRRAAYYVDKILKGTKPADLPVEQPTKFEFVINLKTAKALNLTIPQSVLYRADRVIK
jgi:putative tryptophan/tyrosine transport system substrate-binding protein